MKTVDILFYAFMGFIFLVVTLTDAKAALFDDFSGYQFGDLGYTDVHSRWTDNGFNSLSETRFTTTGLSLGSTARYMRYHNDGTPALDWFYSGSSFRLSWNGLVERVALDIASNYSDRQYHAFVMYGDGSSEDFLLPLEENPRITTVPWAVSSDSGIKSIHFGDINGQIRPQGFHALGIDNLRVGESVPAPAVIWLFLIGLAGLGYARVR